MQIDYKGVEAGGEELLKDDELFYKLYKYVVLCPLDWSFVFNGALRLTQEVLVSTHECKATIEGTP